MLEPTGFSLEVGLRRLPADRYWPKTKLLRLNRQYREEELEKRAGEFHL